MKKIYTAPTRESGLQALEQLKSKWGDKYHYAIKSWYDNWEHLSSLFDFPPEIRTIMYTTNTIENLNRGIRKYTKTKSQFVDESAAKKAVYLAILNIEKKMVYADQKLGISPQSLTKDVAFDFFQNSVYTNYFIVSLQEKLA